MHSTLAPALGVVVVALALAGGVSAENKMPTFQAKVHAPRLTPEYAQITNNTEILFEWHEPRMQQHLWRAATRSLDEGPTRTGKKLRKRADFTPRAVGAPLGRGDCAGCAKLAAGQDADIFSFDWQYMQTQMIPARKNRLKDRCVFYTGLPPDEKIQIQQAKGLLTLPDGQSEIATEYACNNDLITIWQLWPGVNDVAPGSSTDSSKPNFWELHADSWLYRLDKSNNGQYDNNDPSKNWNAYRSHYFRAMSDAVAHSCSGTVYIMAGKTSMGGYIGIWPDTEYPTIKAKAALPDGNAEKVTKLILVKTLDPENEQYLMNIDPALPYPTLNRRMKRGEPDYLDVSDLPGYPANMTDEARLKKRDSCTANLYWETADHGDWFGRGY
ncbi:hypothetical protein B0H67DRAFT_263181 [Lasiosphaeris hirsuta]|uniref:Uncharacterized protein n=1 Tax=Lasiosphaeris hirsuta TaxID=260670 RepID=A0AA40A7C7_9PEZI|nr:hypothetical protein B0H67DRAFT_263181 [Lasiosphaeris hirsuta]